MGKSKSLAKPYEGPYKITSVNFPNVTLDLDGKEKTFHANLIRPFFQFSLLQICLLILAIPLVLGANFSNIIEPLYDQRGLFHNEIGQIGNHVSDYTFVTGFTLSTLQENIEKLKNIKDSIGEYAHQLSHPTSQEEETATIQELTSKFDDLITSTGTIHHRTKRQAALLLGGGLMALIYVGGLLTSKSSNIADLQQDDKVI